MKEKIKSCEGCNAKCCRYVALEIDAPEGKEDFENIKWYVAHKNVFVYVEEDGTWNLEFVTPCEHLGEDALCTNYEHRPTICREYSHDHCQHHNEYKEVFRFENIKDVEKYVEEIFEKGLHQIPEEEDEDDED